MKLTRSLWIKLLGAGVLLFAVYSGWRYTQAYEARLFALDAGTGRVEWSFPLKLDFDPAAGYGRVFAYSTAPLSRPDGGYPKTPYGKEITHTAKLRAFDSATGRQLWEHIFDPQEFEIAGSSLANPPVTSENRVAVRLNDHTLAVLDASNGSLLWHFDQVPNTYKSQPFIFADDHLITYSENDDGSDNVQALDAQTGEPVWNVNMDSDTGAAIMMDKPALTKGEQLVFVNDIFFVQALDLFSGDFQFDIEANAKQLKANGNILYINTENKLLAVDATTGAPLWTFDIPVTGLGPSLFGLQVADPVIYIGHTFGDMESEKGIWLYALNASDGHELWRKQLNQRIEEEVGLKLRDTAVNSEAFFIITAPEHEDYFPRDYILTAFSAADGTERWKFPLHSESSPVAEGDLVFVIDRGQRWQNWLAYVNPAWHK